VKGYCLEVASRLDAFLSARDLDEVESRAPSRTELSKEETARIREALTGPDDPLARRNLLLHPGAIPTDQLLPALIEGMNAADERLVLAAVVGSHRASGEINGVERAELAVAVLGLLNSSSSTLIRQRASAATMLLVGPSDAENLVHCLGDRDSVVRHNVRATLVRVLGARGALGAAREAALARVIPGDALRFVEEAVDAGTASNHELIMRGVLAPQLVPISEVTRGW